MTLNASINVNMMITVVVRMNQARLIHLFATIIQI